MAKRAKRGYTGGKGRRASTRGKSVRNRSSGRGQTIKILVETVGPQAAPAGNPFTKEVVQKPRRF